MLLQSNYLMSVSSSENTDNYVMQLLEKEDSVEKYIIKKHYGIVATPQNKNLGNVENQHGYENLVLL